MGQQRMRINASIYSDSKEERQEGDDDENQEFTFDVKESEYRITVNSENDKRMSKYMRKSSPLVKREYNSYEEKAVYQIKVLS
jgi:hypothetical protein